MFRGGNQNAFFLQAGRVTDLGYITPDCLNFKSIQVYTAKDNSRTRGCWRNPQTHWSPAMQSHTLAFNRYTNCLFKGQVTLYEQITPEHKTWYVVFSPQFRGRRRTIWGRTISCWS